MVSLKYMYLIHLILSNSTIVYLSIDQDKKDFENESSRKIL